MLPNVKTTVIAAITATAVLASSLAPAQALGRNERLFLQGVVAAVIVDKLIESSRQHQPRRQPVYVPRAPDPVYAPQPQHTSVYQTPAARAFNSYGRTERQRIQQRLAAMGYYRSGIDGSFGPGTYNAVVAYARDNGLGDRLASTNTAFGVYDALIY